MRTSRGLDSGLGLTAKNQQNRLWVLVWLGMGAGLLLSATPCHATDPISEYQIKSAYLYNFSKFTTLPEEHFYSDDKTYDLCIIGPSPFGRFLDPLTSRSVDNKSLELHFLDTEGDLSICEVAFITRTASHKLGRILQRADEFNILTISDIEGFALQGGIIGLITRNSHIRFQINLVAAQHNNIHISAKLLELGEVVYTDPAENN